MRSNTKLLIGICFLAIFVLLGFGCGGGGDGGEVTPDGITNTVSGTAAAGAPIVGTINIRGADGNLSYSAINADGSFTVDVSALTAPFVMWAEGTANGKSVKLYSTIDEPGTANVTPATNIVMAMALGDDPDNVYSQDPNAPSPAQDAIEAAKQEIQTRLESVFASLDMPEDFDLMNGEFVADGTGFDKLLDAVGMSYDDTEKTVEMVDKSSGQTLYKKNVETGEVDPASLDADQIDTVVTGIMDIMDTIRVGMEIIETLYATERPTLQELQQQMRPLMADDFFEYGYGPDDTLQAWADPTQDEGPPVGLTIDGLAIHRPMGELTFGDVNPWSIKEFDDNTYAEGIWCVIRGTVHGQTFEFATSYVKEKGNGDWKWYGDRVPFRHGGDIEARAVRDISQGSDPTIYTGLDVYARDEGNLALTNFGIDRFIIFNEALPEWTSSITNNTYHCLFMTKRDVVSTEYRIANVATSFWDHLYLERDTLDIDSLDNPEFIFVGFDSAGPTPVHVWIDLLGAKPLKGSQLDSSQFPEIITPSSLSDLDIPGQVTVSWTNPSGMFADWINLGWYDGQDNTWMDVGNPAWDDPTKSYEDWTSYTFDTSQTTVYPVISAWVQISAKDEFQRDFSTHIQFWD